MNLENHGTRWTVAEDETLLDMWGKEPLGHIAQVLGRTPGTVAVRHYNIMHDFSGTSAEPATSKDGRTYKVSANGKVRHDEFRSADREPCPVCWTVPSCSGVCLCE